MVSIREMGPDDWQAVRDIRLAALRDEPTAFASTYEREITFAEADWRKRFGDRSVTFLASLPQVSPAGIPAGIAGGLRDRPRVVELVSMWVAPAARGHGVGAALVTAVADWAEDRDLHLWVNEGNLAARALYERCGFAVTGERQPMPSDPSLTEIGMLRLR
jgi:GNAT superfamily N-acetyltransferase